MRKTLIFSLLLLALAFSSSLARTVTTLAPAEKKTITVSKPDLDDIRRQTLDPKSRFYFPSLFAKYQKNDTVMTPEEYRYLYLGYMFQEDYDPYRESPYEAKIAPLRGRTQHTRQELDTLVKYLSLELGNNPFDLRSMSFLVHALKEQKKNFRAKIFEYRLENLLAAIKSTGTGENVDNAWYVIYPAHEYDMAQLLGYTATDVDFETYPGIDILKIQPDASHKGRTMPKMYFNVVIPTEQYDLKHPGED